MSEETQNELVQESPQEEMSETEAIAREGGWRPKDEWEGDPDLWVNAAQFNVRGELMGRIKTQTKQIHKQDQEINNLKQGFSEFKEHAKKLAEQEYKQQLSQLKEVKKQALEEQNYDIVVEADEKMADLKASQKEEKEEAKAEPNPEDDPEIAEWLSDNPWYREDIVMQGAADAIATKVREANPNGTPREILNEVSKQVKERFQTQQRGNANPITPQASGRKPGKKSYGKSDLNEEQLAIGKRFVKAGAVKDLKEYAAQLAEIGEL